MSNGKIEKRSGNTVRETHSSVTSPAGKPVARRVSKRGVEKEGEVGNALRSIYQKTVDEAIPLEMLDLLGKLG